MSTCHSASLLQISRESAKLPPRYISLPILNMVSDCHRVQNFEYSSTDHYRNRNSYLRTQFGRKWMTGPWDMKINFRNGGSSACWVFKNCYVGHMTCVCDYTSAVKNFAQIDWNGADEEENFQYWSPSQICKISIFVNHPRRRNSHLPTKFGWNRLIRGKDMEIKLFSILSLRKSRFCSRHLLLRLHVFLHLRSKFRINLPKGAES